MSPVKGDPRLSGPALLHECVLGFASAGNVFGLCSASNQVKILGSLSKPAHIPPLQWEVLRALFLLGTQVDGAALCLAVLHIQGPCTLGLVHLTALTSLPLWVGKSCWTGLVLQLPSKSSACIWALLKYSQSKKWFMPRWVIWFSIFFLLRTWPWNAHFTLSWEIIFCELHRLIPNCRTSLTDEIPFFSGM